MGGFVIKDYDYGDIQKIDLSKPIPKGIYGVFNLTRNCSNIPSELIDFAYTSCTIIGTGTTDMIIGADKKIIISRYNEEGKPQTWVKLI